MTDIRSFAKDPEYQALVNIYRAQDILDEEWGRRNHTLGGAYVHMDLPAANGFTLLKRDRFGCKVVEQTPALLRASFDSLSPNIGKRMGELAATCFTVPVKPRVLDGDSVREGSSLLWEMRVEFWRKKDGAT